MKKISGTLAAVLGACSLVLNAGVGEAGIVYDGGDDVDVIPPLPLTFSKVSMDIAGNGDIYVAAEFQIAGLPPGIEVSRSRDGGATFESFGTILGAARSALGTLVVADGLVDRVFVFYTDHTMFGGFVAYEDLSAESASWTIRQVFPGIDVFHELHADADDIVFDEYYLYAVSSKGGFGEIWFARSVDYGDTWEPAYSIATRPTVDWRLGTPRVSYGDPGRVHVAWGEFTGFDESGIKYRSASSYAADSGSWSPGSQEIVSTSDGVVQYLLDVQASLGGTVTVLCADEGLDALRALSSTDSGATWPSVNDVPLPMTGRGGFGDLAYRPSTDEIVVAGDPQFSGPAFATIPAAAPSGIGPVVVLCDVFKFSDPIAVAIDPGRSDRVALAWEDSEFDPDYKEVLRFDAEWRNDPGWPVQEIVVDLGPPTVGATAPALLSVDSDPEKEIIFSDATGAVHVMSHEGNDEPGWPILVGAVSASVAVGDLENDGQYEIVVSGADGRVHLFHPDGSIPDPVWPYQISGSPAYATIGAVGASTPRSIVVCAGTFVSILAPDGSVEDTWVFGQEFVAPVAIGDVDLDGVNEIVTVNGSLVQVQRYGTPGSTLTKNLPGQTLTQQVALADLDGDGDLEIIAGTEEGHVYVFHHDGTSYAGAWPFQNPSGGPVNQIALAFVPGNPNPDIAFTQRNARTYLLAHDGSVRSGYPVSAYDPLVNQLFAGPILDRVHPHSLLSVVLADPLEFAYQMGTAGNPLEGWPRGLSGPCHVAPACGDIDLDGNAELVFVTDNSLEIFDVSHPQQVDPARRWPMLAYDPERSACLDCFPQQPTSASDPGVRSRLLLSAPYPSPSPTGRVHFDGWLRDAGSVDLEVFDLSGRRLRHLARGHQPGGDLFVEFDGFDDAGRALGSGTYFVRLSVQNGARTERMTQRFTLLR